MSDIIRVMRCTAATVMALLLIAPAAVAQVNTERPPPVAGARPVTLEWIKVHSPAIAGNLEGETADRDVLVVLPPGYAANPRKRYPVVYALHGYFIGAEQWSKEIHLPQTAEAAFAKGAREMIVVLPDSKTIHNGSFYSSSVTTGDFETFISRDLVRHIESRYRAIPDRRSRGLAGHSMGGYGVARIGMKHADVFGAARADRQHGLIM
jgi:enterochelin esterase-like enzyme